MSARVDDDRKAEVLRLRYVEGLSTRAIAVKLSMARRTVRDILGGRRERSDRPRTRAPRESLLAPYDAEIKRILAEDRDLRAPGLLEHLRMLGYRGGISILRDRMRELRPDPRPSVEAFSSFTRIRPAQRLEIDWAHFGFLIPGVPRQVSVFVALLVYSRMLYLEFVLSRGMGSFLRCMERATAFYGGVTEVDVFDNMKTVVLSRVANKPLFAPRFVEYARARGFAITATFPRRPTGKPFVERAISFVRSRFLPGRRFSSLEDLRMQGEVWRNTFANGREHETTGKIPALVFANEERELLRPIPPRPFDTDDLHSTGVDKTHQIYFDRNHYTVPWRLVGQSVLVRADDELVRVLLGPNEVACHSRSWSIAEHVRDERHERGMWKERARRRAGALPPALEPLGDTGARYFAALVATTRSIRAEEQRLVLLSELFGPSATAGAIEDVMKTGHVGADYIENVLRYRRRLEPGPAPLRLGDPALDSIVLPEPDLGVYDDIGARRPLRNDGHAPHREEEETT